MCIREGQKDARVSPIEAKVSLVAGVSKFYLGIHVTIPHVE